MKLFTEKRQERLFKLVKDYYKKNKFDPIHQIDHIERVLFWTIIISKEEKANLSIMIPAAIVHDIALAKCGDELHARKGEIFCKSFLRRTDYNPGEIEKVGKIVRLHSTDDINRERTLEGNVLFDADKMDAIGSVGVFRHALDRINKGIRFTEIGNVTLKWFKKNEKDNSIFFTRSGKKLGKERTAYIKKTFVKLNKELNKYTIRF
ncbi:MAG: HD domain-containing protein [Nanoarchaeota archaeon]|nr:HD domain-containing protein [Nanoarchaeota archaeon]MBU4124263.1 HD domain-containing protein [Nanoarchaeota archaeon]